MPITSLGSASITGCGNICRHISMNLLSASTGANLGMLPYDPSGYARC